MDATAIICDYAQVHAGKLYVIGAAANLAGTPSAAAPHPINIAAAVMITIPWHAHNQLHRLRISLVSDDGEKVPIAAAPQDQHVEDEDLGSVLAQFNAGRSPLMQAGDSTIMPIAVPLNVPVPSLGGYTVAVDIDGSTVATAKFRVLHAAQTPVPTGA